MNALLFFALLGAVGAQTTLGVLANGSLPDGSSGTAVGTGSGANVTGTATVGLNATTSASSVVLTAVGGPASPSPSPSPSPVASPEVTPVVTKAAKPTVVVRAEATTVATCATAKCGEISKYENCGYCLTSSYPITGAGCEYTKEMVKAKKDGNKKKNEYEVVLKPKCVCEGTFITKAESCPTCETALAELLKCAKATASDVVEIPASCLEKVKVTTEFLEACNYIKKEAAPVVPETAPTTPKKYVVEAAKPSPSPKKYTVEVAAAPSPSPKKYVVEAAPTKQYVVATPKASPEATPVATATAPKKATATATASATASATARGL
eukprot:TRINITY_DN372_c1_g1_i1.p2 TRINITY_DN372_c1_g1~~TRINITY_DN372_c1_g1_i1.p2  ORF type:complete len:324 (+),score=87.65 TRINITY_DN372_c1_g1_i1:100-1071(+)